MRAFIDGFNLIRIESDEYIHDVTVLNMLFRFVKKKEHNQYFETDQPIPLQQADTIYINGKKYLLQIGLVTITESFENKYRYKGPLGAIYSTHETEFIVFSPVAKEINLILDNDIYKMHSDGMVYKIKVKGDHMYKKYHFDVRLSDKFNSVIDPYAKMILNNRGIIIPNKRKSKVSPIILSDYKNTYIYECHIRDMTINLDVKNPGLFSGMSEYSKKIGSSVINYIKDLGMTHIQVLPIFEFDGVDPLNKSKHYNWGYNPVNYFSLQSWFSSKPLNPKQTITEFVEMVNRIHDKGLGIIMDVVYNHVSDYKSFSFQKLVPGYFFRHDLKNRPANGSLCGNEVETRRFMVRKLILDSLKYFVNTFQIDGFRFDLMGLIDIETMNLIKKELSKIHPGIMIYGEGWNMGSILRSNEKAMQSNHIHMPKIAHFNDNFRNKIKGRLNSSELGYGTGGVIDLKSLSNLLKGSPNLYSDPSYSINYLECHDNLTLYDKISKYSFDKIDSKMYQDFCNGLVVLSNGIKFFHAGQEMYRSKNGDENSYKSPDKINGLNYILGNHTIYLKSLINFQKSTANFISEYEIFDFGIKIKRSKHMILIKTKKCNFIFNDNTYELKIASSKYFFNKMNLNIKNIGIYIFEKV